MLGSDMDSYKAQTIESLTNSQALTSLTKCEVGHGRMSVGGYGY